MACDASLAVFPWTKTFLKLCLVFDAGCDDNVFTDQKAVKVPQSVCDLGTRFVVFEQIRQHNGGLFRLVGFAKFSQPSERCPVRGALFDPRGSGVPSPGGTQGSGVFPVNVDLVLHEGSDCIPRMVV